jgi:hypothetical protein
MNLYKVTWKINENAKPVIVQVLAQDEEDAQAKAEPKIFATLRPDDMTCDFDEEIWKIEPVSESEMLRQVGAKLLPGFE